MLRFTIRDVLWLTVVVAMGVGWFVDNRRKTDEIMDGRTEWWNLRISIDDEAMKIGYEAKGLADFRIKLVPRPKFPAIQDSNGPSTENDP